MPHTTGEIFGCGMTDTETEELLNALTTIGNIDIVIYGDILIGNDILIDIAARRHASLVDDRTASTAHIVSTVGTARAVNTDDRTAIHRIAERVGNRVEGRGGGCDNRIEFAIINERRLLMLPEELMDHSGIGCRKPKLAVHLIAD